MIVTAWNNGAHMRNGTGYGFRISLTDRDQYFKKDWNSIELSLEDQPETFQIAIDPATFWSDESIILHSKEIGLWLRKVGLSPWPMGRPPVFILNPIAENRFSVERAKKGKVTP
jgi:hypothetical protein